MAEVKGEKKGKTDVEVPAVEAPAESRLLGEELDVIHVNCMAHMANVAYSEHGANLFECPVCHRKAMVMEYKGE